MAKVKGFLCACVLAALESMTVARAYEADIHYSATYVLARAVGWQQADALTIASANQGVDENQDTVAALEVDSLSSSLHQADKNLNFHCFGKAAGEAGGISADVRKVISRHFAEVPHRDEDPQSHARRLIALGTALHCQQDAYSHAGFGGSCGPHAGSCSGHTYETFLDRVVFGVVKKHFFDPDHPGVSGHRVVEALEGTAGALSALGPKNISRSIPAKQLSALSNSLRASGLELPDDVRRECNRYIAGKWLFEFLRSDGRTQNTPDTLEKLGPEVAGSCRNESLASATVVRIPDPRFPRLNADASPYRVSADGTYQLSGGEDLHAFSPRIPNSNVHRTGVQLSHWRQLIALPLIAQIAL